MTDNWHRTEDCCGSRRLVQRYEAWELVGAGRKGSDRQGCNTGNDMIQGRCLMAGAGGIRLTRTLGRGELTP